MARVASRKSCMKKVSRTLHKKATTKRQRKQIIGKASKACSRKMRVRRAGKKTVRKVIRKKSVRKVVPRQTPSPVPMSPPTPAQIDDYSYDGYLQRFEEAAARVAGVQGECTPNALTRALRSESRNLLIDLNNEDRAAYEADPRRQNMIRAYEVVLGRCEADPFNNMVQARQAVQNV